MGSVTSVPEAKSKSTFYAPSHTLTLQDLKALNAPSVSASLPNSPQNAYKYNKNSKLQRDYIRHSMVLERKHTSPENLQKYQSKLLNLLSQCDSTGSMFRLSTKQRITDQSDILLFEVHDDELEFKYVFVQIKYADDPIKPRDLANSNGQFSMANFLEMYQKLKLETHCSHATNFIKHFVVVTNANFSDRVLELDFLLPNCNIPGIKFGQFYEFRYFPAEWFPASPDTEEFRQKLLFAVGQPREAEIDQILSANLGRPATFLEFRQSCTAPQLRAEKILAARTSGGSKSTKTIITESEYENVTGFPTIPDLLKSGRSDLEDLYENMAFLKYVMLYSFDKFVGGEIVPWPVLKAHNSEIAKWDEFFYNFVQAWESDNPNILEKVNNFLTFKDLLRIWDRIDSLAPKLSKRLLSLFETRTSGIFQHASIKNLNFLHFFKNVDPFVRLIVCKSNYIYISSTFTALSFIKFAQAIKSVPDCSSYAFLNIRSLLQFRSCMDTAFAQKKDFLLVLLWSRVPWEVQREAEKYVLSLRGKLAGRQKVVLICEEGDIPWRLKINKLNWKECKDDWEYENVSKWIRVQFLAQELTFQGQKIPISGFFQTGNEDWSTRSGEILNVIAKNGPLTFGHSNPAFGEPDCCYIPRFFRWNVKCTKDSLAEMPDSEILVLSGRPSVNTKVGMFRGGKMKLAERSSNGRESFQRIAGQNQDQNVHWLRWNGTWFVLIESAENHMHSESDLVGCASKVCIIAGESGIGKTVTTSHMVGGEKRRDPDLWVITVNLLDMSDTLAKLKQKDELSVRDAMDFLCLVENLHTKMEREILLDRISRVILFVDEFEQICPMYELTALSLLKLLKATEIRKIWVSTRPHCTRILEMALSCGSYTLLPFSKDDQRAFLEKSWTSLLALNASESENLGAFARNVKELLHVSYLKNINQVIHAPMLLRLLARVHQYDCRAFCRNPSRKPVLDKTVDVLKLYERFVEQSYDQYFTQERLLRSSLHETLSEQHQYHALQLLFPNEAQCFLGNVILLDESATKHLVGVGIVEAVNGKHTFVHGTFVEFFAAQYFAKVIRDRKRHNTHRIAVIEFLKEHYFSENCDLLRLFLDHLLAKGSRVHQAALRDNFEELVPAVFPGPENIFSIDPLSRTAFHLAAAYSKCKNLAMSITYGENDGEDIYSLVNENRASRVLEYLCSKFQPERISQRDELDFPVTSYAYPTLGKPEDTFTYLTEIQYIILGQEATRETLARTLAVVNQRTSGSELDELCSYVRNQFPNCMDDFRKQIYCGQFLQWTKHNFKKSQQFFNSNSDQLPMQIFIEHMLNFFKGLLANENHFGELLKAHNACLASLKDARDEFASLAEFTTWLKSRVQNNDFVSLFQKTF